MGGLREHPDAMQLAAFIDGCLDAAEADRVNQHLASCAACRELYHSASDKSLPETSPPSGINHLAKAMLREGAIRLTVFIGEGGLVLADASPYRLLAPKMADFFSQAREHATLIDSRTLQIAGLTLEIHGHPNETIDLSLSGGVDSLWLGIDDWQKRSEVPCESGRYHISEITCGEYIETSMMRQGRHFPLEVSVQALPAAHCTPEYEACLIRAAARALTSGRIAAFAKTSRCFDGRLPNLTRLSVIMDGWRVFYPSLWVTTVILARKIVRGESEEDATIDPARLEALQPWLPFEGYLAKQHSDTRRRDEMADTAFLNLARQELCFQVLTHYDAAWVERMADPTIYRIRGWLLFVAGKWSEALCCLEKAIWSARAKGNAGKALAELCRQEHSLLLELDHHDATHCPVVPQDIFESFWNIGAGISSGNRW